MTTEELPVRHERSAAPKRKSRGIWLFIRDLVIILVAAIVISILIKAFLIRSFYIPSGSMEDTLEINDRIIVNELVPKLTPIQHGDVVVFKDPGGWLNPRNEPEPNWFAGSIDWALSVVGLSAPDSNDHLIKRVIGLPGDTVECCNVFGQMSVNGVPLSEPYLKLPAGVSKASGTDFKVTVPKDSLWVMGDNRYDSADSRYNTNKPGKGFVPIENVVGKAFVISWPMSRWTWLDNYPTVFAGVEDKDN
ncbi:MAG: signal peptidase I [Cryobacterium sp.]|nr:signal peptidase I [Cryobacterium sp.]MBX3089207.1 signal peptidase I [Cryobacterium sp.]MBX3115725.1 signal peptidase I [Cryobacterium sp.]